MRNLILLAHVSLDGYMADPDGDLRFVTIDDEINDHLHPLIHTCDAAVYGRVTYELMAGYWPSIVDDASASETSRTHARWYMGVDKLVASRTLPAASDPKLQIVADDVAGALAALKRRPGGDIMIFGSPTLVHSLRPHDLIDEWRLTIQPVTLGGGLPLFTPTERRTQLALRSAKIMTSGVIATHYVTKR